MGKELTEEKVRFLVDVASSMRKDILDMGLSAGSTGIHLGGSFSCVEILAVLFCAAMNINTTNLEDPNRDRFVFSKGHGAPALWAALHHLGIVADDELGSFKKPGTFLTGHPSRNIARGVDFSSGSLGQGLSLGVGVGLAAKARGIDKRCFVLLGDGECDEGSIWEAAMSAAHFGINNLTAIVDANVLQYDGPTDDVMSLGDLCAKWSAFGWEVREVDGHDVSQLYQAFVRESDAPVVVIARTVKGKGASFAEGVSAWHNSRLTQQLYNQAINDLGLCREDECGHDGD
ncbi:transketolase [Adlercreutzia sp. ZJ138]|uniref:transketolase n=1 Tax=Adlercreutzia sp. ZJ138 TaxID=2709405 RepID=UPI0013EAC664|nr:transketolase [Adlercreutzia sp. ZJ138]